MDIRRNRALGALVCGVVAVTALGTPVLAGTAALGSHGGNAIWLSPDENADASTAGADGCR
jgi:hypothetical protein